MAASTNQVKSAETCWGEQERNVETLRLIFTHHIERSDGGARFTTAELRRLRDLLPAAPPAPARE